MKIFELKYNLMLCNLGMLWLNFLSDLQTSSSEMSLSCYYFSAFFAILHSWLNAFAEMLRFADRLFYKVRHL